MKEGFEAVSDIAMWMSEPSSAAIEVAELSGFEAVVLDVEHGSFDLSSLSWVIPFIKAKGLSAIAKVLGPGREPIQQALDFGADAIAIPHIESVEHAREITEFAKFPPLGKRSFAGGHTANYGRVDDDWVNTQNLATMCFPMIEDKTALEEVEGILALDTVDGVFVGPTDLSLLSGRGAYSANEQDFRDIKRIAAAARTHNKPWIIPAWTTAEKELAVAEGAHTIVSVMQHSAMLEGFIAARNEVLQFKNERTK